MAASSAEEWADSVFSRLSPRERVAQLFVPRLDIFDNQAGRAQLKAVVEAGMGGFLLGKGTPKGYATLNNYAQSLAKVPLLVTLDGEWGPAMRVSSTVRFPYNMGLGAIRNPKVLVEYGLEVARQCRELGIQVDFAPVLDVNSNPANPVIGYRSFGEDPRQVARLGTAFSFGLEQGGVMAVGKHFPGHGDTSTDSHKTLPTVDHSRATLNSVDLVPFVDYINQGFGGIMVGHLKVPALDASGTPASLSRKITTGLLKDELGYNGLVFTDALVMKGAVSGENNCVAALKAGADVLLGSGAPLSDLEAVMKALQRGELRQEDIDKSVMKILRAKYDFGLADYTPVKLEGLEARLNSPEAAEVARRLSEASITVVRNTDGLLPLHDLGRISVSVITVGKSPAKDFISMCRRYTSVKVYTSPTPEALKADVVIAAVTSDDAASRTALQTITDKASNPLPVFFINPYKMAKFSAALKKCGTLVTAYDLTPALQNAAAQALFGGIAVDGRMPVNLPGIARLGEGVTLKKIRLGYAADAALERKIDAIVNEALAANAMPGCQVVVGRGGNIVVSKSYGRLSTTLPDSVTSQTLYDIASMSKATATVAGLMKAYDEELFTLNDRVSEYIPALLESDKEKLTVRELLLHESGMPPSLNMNLLMMDTASYTSPLMKRNPTETYSIKIDNNLYGNRHARLRSDITARDSSEIYDMQAAEGIYVGLHTLDTIRQRIYDAKLGPKKYRYSCLNFCLLAEMEENLTGVDHDQWVATEIFEPLGATSTGYRPREWYPLSKIAPTENDGFLRKQLLRGYSHDELAAFSGGVQGNAGLFSTAEDIAKYCQMLLNGGEYGGTRILSPKAIKLFTTTLGTGGKRALGFDKPAANTKASSSTYGHTGFTGTCFWIDPENDMFMVFLSNRVNPTRVTPEFNRLKPRTAILNALYD